MGEYLPRILDEIWFAHVQVISLGFAILGLLLVSASFKWLRRVF